jgi:hypothetical protein
MTLTLQNAQRFCTLLANRLPNLKKVSFNIYDSYGRWNWKPSRIVNPLPPEQIIFYAFLETLS